MRFTYWPLKQQMRIEFGDKIPHDADMFDKAFPDGTPLLSDEGDWIGVECEPLQWQTYMLFVLEVLRKNTHTDPQVIRSLQIEYLRFMAYWDSIKEMGAFQIPDGRLNA